jgi:predicted RNA-binding protein associated with RNAse of E/G family
MLEESNVRVVRTVSKGLKISRGFHLRIHLSYVRLLNRVLDLYDRLVYRSKSVVTCKSKITSEHPVVFDGETVLSSSFQIIYFQLTGKWLTIGKIRNLNGSHTGYYCGIVTPPHLLEDGGMELTDLFLDLWVSLDLRYKVLDEEELERVLCEGWITRDLCCRARKKLEKLVDLIEKRECLLPLANRLMKELRL